MDSDINTIVRDVALNSPGLANNEVKARNDSKVIHGETVELVDSEAHITTTLSITSSNKTKVLFIINILLSVVCMVASCSVMCYYWKDMMSMKVQVDLVREQCINHNLKVRIAKEYKPVHDSVMMRPRSQVQVCCEQCISKDDISQSVERYHAEGLELAKAFGGLAGFQKGPLIVHFIGALRETNMGSEAVVGPWRRDLDVSTKGSENIIELHTNYFIIQESGLYFVYTQIVFTTYAPNFYFIWARQPNQEPRLVTTCAMGEDTSTRALNHSQISCKTHTLARIYKGDTVNIAQREHNQPLWLLPGYTYFGFIKISS